MKYANQISEMINAFSPEPLKIEQMEQFYCSNTMEYRMSDKYSSPMEDIFDICQEKRNRNAFLLLLFLASRYCKFASNVVVIAVAVERVRKLDRFVFGSVCKYYAYARVRIYVEFVVRFR